MARLKVKTTGSGTRDDPYTVDLPTWQGIQFDTDRGKTPPNAFAIVDVPDDEVDEKTGKIDRVRLKVKYGRSQKDIDEDKPPTKWETHNPDIGDEKPA